MRHHRSAAPIGRGCAPPLMLAGCTVLFVNFLSSVFVNFAADAGRRAPRVV
jgi:hypothetical protein